jgi:hypothetical protein
MISVTGEELLALTPGGESRASALLILTTLGASRASRFRSVRSGVIKSRYAFIAPILRFSFNRVIDASFTAPETFPITPCVSEV